jgi:hypothetical protein
MDNSLEILRLKKLAGLLSESEIHELGLKDLGVGAAMTVASLFGSPQQTKAQEPQQIVQQASTDTKAAKEEIAKEIKELKELGYKPMMGSLITKDAIKQLQDIIDGGTNIVQGKAVGNTLSAANSNAIQNANRQVKGKRVQTNVAFYRELENKNVEVLVFLGSK